MSGYINHECDGHCADTIEEPGKFEGGPGSTSMSTPAISTALAVAITHLAADYHSGQWSRGYRLGCRAQRWLSKRGITRPLDIPTRGAIRGHYRKLEAAYSDKL